MTRRDGIENWTAEDLPPELEALADELGITRDELLRRLRELTEKRLARDRDALPPDEARPADI